LQNLKIANFVFVHGMFHSDDFFHASV